MGRAECKQQGVYIGPIAIGPIAITQPPANRTRDVAALSAYSKSVTVVTRACSRKPRQSKLIVLFRGWWGGER